MQNTKRTILIAILFCAGFGSEEGAVNQKNGQGSILMGEGIRDSNKFPLKHARERIKKLKNHE
ncbi:MAG: hypothetical protein ACYSWZ_05265 [Planctomycetota bacterium]|jgi:hypothetical protein